MKRIVLTGAESTGKSTLARALAAYYQAPCSREYVRHYANSLGRDLNKSDLEAIAHGQLAEEKRVVDTKTDLVFHDTNLLSSIIYAHYYFETEIDWVDATFARENYALYLLCMPDIPWVADEGQRESPEARQRLHHLFMKSLKHRKLPFVEISGSLEQRKKQSIAAVDMLT